MVYRVFVEKKKELAHEAKALLNEAVTLLGIKNLTDVRVLNRYDAENITSAKMDVESLLAQMTNLRYAYVIRRLILQDKEPAEVADELGITVDNLYNIKKRALSALFQIAHKEL